MAIIFLVCILLEICFTFADLFVMKLAGSDDKWATNWFWENVHFFIFTAFTCAIMYVLSPTESLK